MNNNNFYIFRQNNSGGSFTVDKDLSHFLFIEAPSEKEAMKKALDLGVYFYGVDEGIDCPCCGDRWSEYCDEIKFPYEYGFFDEEEIKEEKYSGFKFFKTKEKSNYGKNYYAKLNNIEEYAAMQLNISYFRFCAPKHKIVIHYSNGEIKYLPSNPQNNA